MPFPTDLVVLPTTPWDERPTELPLDIEECRTALWQCRGNITKAAELLKVSSARLRNFVTKSNYLTREKEEAQEQLLDIGEDNIYEAMTDATDPGRRDSMTRFVMASLGRKRGFGNGAGGALKISAPAGKLTVEWGDGSTVVGTPDEPEEVVPGDNAKVING